MRWALWVSAEEEQLHRVGRNSSRPRAQFNRTARPGFNNAGAAGDRWGGRGHSGTGPGRGVVSDSNYYSSSNATAPSGAP